MIPPDLSDDYLKLLGCIELCAPDILLPVYDSDWYELVLSYSTSIIYSCVGVSVGVKLGVSPGMALVLLVMFTKLLST